MKYIMHDNILSENAKIIRDIKKGINISQKEKYRIESLQILSYKVFEVLELIYEEINLCKEFDISYITLLKEFEININTNFHISLLCSIANEYSLEKYKFLNLFNEKFPDS